MIAYYNKKLQPKKGRAGRGGGLQNQVSIRTLQHNI